MIKEKEKNGYKEIVLTGVNIERWREKDKDLIWLIKKILKKTKIERIRISSLWPEKIDDRFLSLFENKRVCQHLHLSLQSLSPSVLKRMGRFYNLEKVEKIIKKIKKKFPNLTLTADIIVGFPNETDKEFKQTYKKLKELKLAKIHVFRYSLREGTKAAEMINQIDEKTKKKRAKIILNLSKKLEKEWKKKNLGQIRQVLFEKKKDNFWQGLTDNYLKVFVKSEKNLANQILPVKLVKLYKEGLLGKLI
jgi:threonylcarbamoyladenosine tRNA methylthiotransferase MtaB